MAKNKKCSSKILNERVTRKPKRDKSLLLLLCLFDQEMCIGKVIKALWIETSKLRIKGEYETFIISGINLRTSRKDSMFLIKAK